MPIAAHIQIEGLKELQAGLRGADGKLPKALGEAHKRVGQFIISKIDKGNPNAVGAGGGATVRASATKRDVILRVGYAGRLGDWDQWGKKRVRPVAPGPNSRPYIVGTIEANEDEVEDLFLDEMVKVVGPAFYYVKMSS